MPLTKITIASALLAATLATSASAMTQQQEAAFRQSCGNDYMRFCSMFEPNTPQVEQCFQQRMKELSPRCQSAIASFSKSNPEGRKR
jgi:hypothetical protein